MSHHSRIRRATPEDAHALAGLRYELRIEATAGRASQIEEQQAFIERCEHWMTDALAADSWLCWIGERLHASHIEAIGSIWLELVEKVPNPIAEAEWHGYVTNFFVRDTARNVGVGSALLTALIAQAQSLGLDALFLWPTPRSRSLYERHGFSAGAVLSRVSPTRSRQVLRTR